MGEDVHENPVKEINSRVALTAEGETGAALDAATIEPKDDRAMATEENTDLVTIESSPKWGGTLIELVNKKMLELGTFLLLQL